VNNIFPIPGSRKKFQRIGRGIAAGQGASCGRGMRGQKSRAGRGKGVRSGFEGGQTPLYRRLPKYCKPHPGHVNRVYELIKINQLNDLPDNSIVYPSLLYAKGLITKPNKGHRLFKVVGSRTALFGSTSDSKAFVSNDKLTVKGLTILAHAFSESAKQEIESNGGICVTLSPTRHVPLDPTLMPRNWSLALAALELQQEVKKREVPRYMVSTMMETLAKGDVPNEEGLMKEMEKFIQNVPAASEVIASTIGGGDDIKPPTGHILTKMPNLARSRTQHHFGAQDYFDFVTAQAKLKFKEYSEEQLQNKMFQLNENFELIEYDVDKEYDEFIEEKKMKKLKEFSSAKYKV
jgi:large subunit ribosomal protein L15